MINKVILVGYVGNNPEHKNLDSGQQVCTFSVATNETYKNKAGLFTGLIRQFYSDAWNRRKNFKRRDTFSLTNPLAMVVFAYIFSDSHFKDPNTGQYALR